VTTACTDTKTASTLLAAFVLPQALDSVVAVEVVIDLQHSAPSLPAWWQVGPGGCRSDGIRGSAAFAPLAGCTDFWQGQATTDPLPFVYTPGSPHGQPNQARMIFSAAVPAVNQRLLNGGEMYYAIRVAVLHTGPSCAGCGGPACLVLNSILIGRTPSAPGGNLLLEQPGPVGANRATWQGKGADCLAVPARPMTWARLKSIYR
jgi:hypothetical protein